MDDITVHFDTTHGKIAIRVEPCDFMAEPGFALTSMELQVNGAPVVRLPFHIHGGRLHTICRRIPDDDVDAVEY